jgi:starch synthase (maltosyl-transferring)
MYAGFELFEGEAVKPGSEEYKDSEKYELRPRDFHAALNEGRSLEPYITRLNEIRRSHPALQQLRNIHFHETDHDELIAYSKTDPATGDTVIMVITLNSFEMREGTVRLDMPELGMDWDDSFRVHDEITGETWQWGERNYVRLEPWANVAHILRLEK